MSEFEKYIREFEKYIENHEEGGYVAVHTCPVGHEIVEVEVFESYSWSHYRDWLAVPVGTDVHPEASQWDENRIKQYQDYKAWYWCDDNQKWAYPDWNSVRRGENQIWYDGEVRG